MMPTICCECGHLTEYTPNNYRCPSCSSPRLKCHEELNELFIAHIDCDAFYASVEKVNNPTIKDKPVIVGGGQRGVVSACCYIARLRGVHSAMPTFQARNLCPEAIFIKPNMAEYSRIGLKIKKIMLETTPLVEPLSIDEAFLDLSGTANLHGATPAQTLIRLVQRIETETGVSASIGLSYNKFLAKTASDMDKPKGFFVIGKGEAVEFLSNRPVDSIWGVGASMSARLARDGIKRIGQLREIDPNILISRYGSIGQHLSRLSRGNDLRRVNPQSRAKSISSESTFSEDIKGIEALSYQLWPLCEKVADRLKSKKLAASGISLKLKTTSFQVLTRSLKLPVPTQLAEVIYRATIPLLEKEANAAAFRLIGIGATNFGNSDEADKGDLFGNRYEALRKIEDAMAELRLKYGYSAIKKGRII